MSSLNNLPLWHTIVHLSIIYNSSALDRPLSVTLVIPFTELYNSVPRYVSIIVSVWIQVNYYVITKTHHLPVATSLKKKRCILTQLVLPTVP